ncbi:helix-turn-helix domain-containing protein [Flaviflexus massiliensis]|uniref:helix-turn-helix domain-containing protein n=1 Tax=Flaviflexus massiliensis TaxID=1522309 RepID=UPI0006D56F64|nr:helix-turn-helix domain-containing protein [Flaviflexus massiliensis]
MTDLDQARTHMQDIIQWWDILGDVAETATGVVGHRLSMTGVHGTPKDATVTAILQIDAVDTIQKDVEALAGKLGWRPRRDGDPKIYILGNLEWAALNLAPIEWTVPIDDLHRRVGSLTGHAPRPTQRLCPLCGETLRIIPPDRPTWHTASERRAAASEPDRFTCDGCGETRTSEEIETLFRWRISNADAQVLPREASRLLGIPEQTIYSWIRRGLLERTGEAVSLSDTATLRKDHT